MARNRLLVLLAPVLLSATMTAVAQQNRDDFYNGVRNGSQGGQYESRGRHHDDNQQNGNRDNNGQYRNNGQYQDNGQYRNDGRYDDRQNHQGGIGPGKGALIGGGGGAVLGALFGGGLKGSIIGGAAGAGIGAVVGKEHQNSVRRNDGYYPR